MDQLDTSRMIIPEFQDALLDWGHQHFRQFPWRATTDPYAILVAEIMLHRTQAMQVVPVYQRFISRFPSLSQALEGRSDEIARLLFPLGLRWRVGLMCEMFATLRERFDGQLPATKEELISLPGISEYIASAVRCFGWNLPEPLIDTNTVRVISRLYNLPLKDSSRRNARFKERIAELVSDTHPAAYNYALLDLAALICTKVREPSCGDCPVRAYCRYGQGQYRTRLGR